MTRWVSAVIVVAMLAVAPLLSSAQEATPAPTPALTDVEKLQIQNLSQAIEIAQLKAQAAQRDFDVAREALGRLVQTLQRPGYELNWQTLTYAKTPEPGQK